MKTAEPPDQQALQSLSQLLQLEQQARSALTTQELAFVMVNDSRLLLDYRQALLWSCDRSRIDAISGLAVVEQDAPFNIWLSGLCKRWQDQPDAQHIHSLNTAGLATDDLPLWAEHFPAHLIWMPLRHVDGRLLGALLLARETLLPSSQEPLAALLINAYGHAWAALLGKSSRRKTGQSHKRRWLAGLLATAVLLSLPVRQSVLAPAEIVARQPSVLRAPLQGVVEKILVKPNELVQAGQVLVQLDARELQSRLESSRQAMAIADAEFRQAQQQALSDERSKATLAVLQGRREQAQTEVYYLQESLKRMNILAPRAGVAVFDDPSDWVGRPVSLGERIMLVAEPSEAQLDIQLPIADAIDLQPGADILMFLNTDPTSPLPASLQRLAYRASPTADGSMAYRLKAEFTEADPRIRVGLKGTAKLYGERTSVLYYLLRRPLSALRIWLAL
ncbi:efflux RND transporter periplasmic adaptor subunit [Pseudomonas viridiflava]|uniref:efflux RND transporter periplasmic adaptor subunit n=1 Tax=Pseudomonas viridiflava TaxID=33069 RepID=UPI000F05AB20|nr:HlyD family efflux transporter periplasmic adaptor subunit [Pseudomonas viridiflava]